MSHDISAVESAFQRGANCAALAGRRVTVMGLGRFGGGVGVVRFLLSQGARVTLTDAAPAETLVESLRQIETSALSGLTLGRHDERDFRNADLVVVNPAVKRNHPFLKLAAESGVPLISEICLFWQRNRSRVIAVTGSVGKSTTTALIHTMLAEAGVPTILGGNIGRSLLSQLEQLTSEFWTVLELSSFQLWDLNLLRAAPDVAVITNLFPNHLDWHGSFDRYAEAKRSITRWQSHNQVLVSPADDPLIAHWPTAARRVQFGTTLPAGSDAVACDPAGISYRDQRGVERIAISNWPASLRGQEQRLNVAAAIAAVTAAHRFPLAGCLESLLQFPGLPHRREHIGTWRGRIFINDSKATTPQAAIAALQACSEGSGRLLLIAGGADKGSDLAELSSEIDRRASAVALLGQTATTIRAKLQCCLEIQSFNSLAQAMEWLCGISQPGDTILLSPGCASFGEFVNYEQRGETFRQLAQSWGERGDGHE